MSDLYKELEPIGQYSIGVLRFESDLKDSVALHCKSALSPIVMRISFPDLKNPLAPVDSLHLPGETAYMLQWPTEASKEEVIEIIRDVGDRQLAPNFICMDFSQDELPIEGEEAFGEVNSDSANIQDGPSLNAALLPDFDELTVESPALSLEWHANPDLGGPEFSLITAGNDHVTEPYILDMIRRSIVSGHVGSIAVALENLGAIFEQYREASPAELMGAKSSH